eukprot:9996483-Heterocapsa_arctica.AAC.1
MKNAIYACKVKIPRSSTATDEDSDNYRTLFPVEASQVGFMWRLCRRLQGSWADFVDEDPLALTLAAPPAAAAAAANTSAKLDEKTARR